SQALDAASRTLQVELQIDNGKGELLPGSYAQVHFKLSPDENTLRIPVNAVLFRTQGLQVAALDADHRVQLKTITEGRDFGPEIEVLPGAPPDDVLVLTRPDSISDGAQVRLAPEGNGSPAPAGGKS